jgi:hypothetical protein
MKKSVAIKLALVMIPVILSGCVEQDISLRDLRSDIPELIIDSSGGPLKLYIMGIEKHRYPRLELYVNGEKVAEGDQTLALSWVTDSAPSGEIEVRAVAVTQSATYAYACKLSMGESGIRLRAKSERLIEWKDMPYEIIMEAEK